MLTFALCASKSASFIGPMTSRVSFQTKNKFMTMTDGNPSDNAEKFKQFVTTWFDRPPVTHLEEADIPRACEYAKKFIDRQVREKSKIDLTDQQFLTDLLEYVQTRLVIRTVNPKLNEENLLQDVFGKKYDEII
eukprot:gene1189-2313_t